MGMTIPSFLAEGWLNEAYSVAMNQSHPLLQGSKNPGPPYFVDTKTAWKGQWVRLIFRSAKSKKTTDGDFWCVGKIVEVIDPNNVRVGDIGHEGGLAPKAFRGRWGGMLVQGGEPSTWTMTEMARDRASLEAEMIDRIVAASDRKAVVAAVEAARKEAVPLPETIEVATALLQHDDEDQVVLALGMLERLIAKAKPEHPQILESRVRRWENDGEGVATREAADRVMKVLRRR